MNGLVQASFVKLISQFRDCLSAYDIWINLKKKTVYLHVRHQVKRIENPINWREYLKMAIDICLTDWK